MKQPRDKGSRIWGVGKIIAGLAVPAIVTAIATAIVLAPVSAQAAISP